MKNSKDKTVLVTGANSGIGKAIAIAFGKNGCNVAVNYITHEEKAEEVVNTINTSGGKAIAIKADVSKEDEVVAMFQKTVNEFGTLDVLINNAGIERSAHFIEMKLEDWQKVIDVNLTGSFLCAREASRIFINKEISGNLSPGNIIFISSVHEKIPWAKNTNYTASKGGIRLLMETIAQELAHKKIRVNNIAPGAIKTDINKEVWSNEETRVKLEELIPYGRLGNTEDIAKTVLWLSSEEASYITGTTIFIDGGMSLYPGFINNG